MATFKAITKARRKDGFYPVYIRVTHQTKLAYIVTDKLVNALEKARVIDPFGHARFDPSGEIRLTL